MDTELRETQKKDTLLDYWRLVTYVKSEKSNSLLHCVRVNTQLLTFWLRVAVGAAGVTDLGRL